MISPTQRQIRPLKPSLRRLSGTLPLDVLHPRFFTCVFLSLKYVAHFVPVAVAISSLMLTRSNIRDDCGEDSTCHCFMMHNKELVLRTAACATGDVMPIPNACLSTPNTARRAHAKNAGNAPSNTPSLCSGKYRWDINTKASW